jgi:two-component system chemotaxis response regulator CheB
MMAPPDYSVKSRNGIAIVQDPAEATAPDMPRNAMRNVQVDYCLPLAEIAPLLVRLARGEDGSIQRPTQAEDMMMENQAIVQDPPPSETQISLACPECSGPIYEAKEGQLAHFQCNVGHAYSPLSLSAAHSEALERALWVAVRTLNERITLHREMLRRRRNEGEQELLQRLEQSVGTAEKDVELLRQIIERI